MKKKISLMVLLLATGVSYAQINLPAASPVSTLTQKFGLTEIKIEYCRPSANERKVFGNIVPYDSIWRAGANDGTFFTTNDSLTINGKGLAKGKYLIITRPGKTSWDIYFNKNLAADYIFFKPEENVFKITVPSQTSNAPVETFTISVDDIKSNSCNLAFKWENTVVKVPIEENIHARIMDQIKQKLAGPTRSEYSDMARYYIATGGDLNEALAFANKSIEMSEGYGNLYLKAVILSKLGNKKEAIVFAKKSLERGLRFNHQDYVLMNRTLIAELEK